MVKARTEENKTKSTHAILPFENIYRSRVVWRCSVKKGVLKNFRDSFLIKLQIRGPYIKRYLNINILSVQNFKNLIFEILKFHFKHQELENHSCKVYINLIITLESLLNLLLKRCWGRSRLILPLLKYFGSRVRCNVAQTAGVRQWKS